MPTLGTSVNAQSNLDLLQFTQGIELDKPLAPFEIQVQKAWANGLQQSGLINEKEKTELSQALDEALQLISENQFHWKVEDEDIHMNLERFLCEKVGSLGKRIHIGRSRNDLIATTLRLFVADVCQKTYQQLDQLIGSLVSRAEKDINVIVPGQTHLQFGQPVRLSQIYLAHAWSFKRDQEKMKFAQEIAVQSMPLGSAAMSGTHIKIDLQSLAESLGFQNPPENSYDSVGSRDFILQSLQSLSSVAIHLSRLAEDVIIWSSQPYQWVALPKAWSTGSSIMPNKRNPDVLELIRAKAAQVIGAETSAMVLLKGLVSSYSSDLHELKRVYLQALPLIKDSLSVLPEFMDGLEVNSEKILSHLNQGHLLATEIANQLTSEGLPFREAYQKVAFLVEEANAQNKQIHELGFEVSFEQAVECRCQSGGTSKSQVLQQLKKLSSGLK